MPWLQRGTLARGERTGLNWILRRLRMVKRESYSAARRQVRQEFGRTAELLGRRLGELGNQSPPLRETFGLLLRRQAADLETRLAAIRDAEDEKRAHQARISAKRLRYLLEPLRRESEGVRQLVDHMKGKSAIHIARTYFGRRQNYAGEHSWGPRVLRVYGGAR